MPRWRWSTRGSKPTARKPRRLSCGPPFSDALLHLDVLPEAEALGDLVHLRPRRLVGPGGAGMTLAGDHHVVKLHAMRTFEIMGGPGGLLQPVHAHRLARKVLISLAFDDIIALGNHLPVNNCTHDALRLLLLPAANLLSRHATQIMLCGRRATRCDYL